MVERGTTAELERDRRFRALADPTRRDILARTLEREHSVGELAERYPMSFAAVQKHVAVLEAASLVTKRARHRHRFVRGNPDAVRSVAEALDELERAWNGRLERFEAELGDGRARERDH
jgi:DNA-binding transcriptional ArsR family regulator